MYTGLVLSIQNGPPLYLYPAQMGLHFIFADGELNEGQVLVRAALGSQISPGQFDIFSHFIQVRKHSLVFTEDLS